MEEEAKRLLGNLLDLVSNVVETASASIQTNSDSPEAEEVAKKGKEIY